MFCDEVGLGKTIEAGLALRQLIVTGRVRRALILCPKNLLRQWQEELWEKLALDVLRFEDGQIRDRWDRDRWDRDRDGGADTSPWDAHPLLLASTQLARQEGRREELLRASPWDLIIVDEAHQARRRDRRPGAAGRPNRLLELLTGSADRKGLRQHTKCLYLLTATPMQLHPAEIWDLLRLVGLGGRWGASEELFLAYFAELRKPYPRRDWPLLLSLLAESREVSAPPPELIRSLRKSLDDAALQDLLSLTGTTPAHHILSLNPAGRQGLEMLLRHFTPLADHLFRHTRAQLRRYQDLGLLNEPIPRRRPENVWIELTPAERTLYERIDEYLAEVFRREEPRRESAETYSARQGLGFLATVYRRRLTSSFEAIRRSFQRRVETLSKQPETVAGNQTAHEREIRFLTDFITELHRIGPGTKVRRLLSDLDILLSETTNHKALVFTQYIDTLDLLREVLVPIWGERAACYSGRGGEHWSPSTRIWTPIAKETLKERFRRGEIRVLICTDAASEGLNLQTCGILINYDMPWNPMRVEQRIGRIDRIGQIHPEVRILNYFYARTVEAEIYRRLSDRISWFEDVVGRLQPILARVGEAIETLAMMPPARRRKALEEDLARLHHDLDENTPPAIEWSEAEDLHVVERAEPLETPLRLPELEEALLRSPLVGGIFLPDEEISGVYQVRRGERSFRITFSPKIFDRHTSTVELLTWGNPLLDEILSEAAAREHRDDARGLSFYRARRPVRIGLFMWPDEEGVRRIRTLKDLDEALTRAPEPWTQNRESHAAASFSQARRRALDAWRDIEIHRRQGELLALTHGARSVLLRSALIELARHRSMSLFDTPSVLEFGPDAVIRLGERGEPFRGLLRLIEGETLIAASDDPYFLDVAGRTRRILDRRAKALIREGRELVHRAAGIRRELDEVRREARAPSAGGLLERIWFPPRPIAEEEEQSQEPTIPEALDPARVRAWKNAVPRIDDLRHLAHEEEALSPRRLEGLADAWVALEGRTRPRRGVFVARVPGRALEQRLAPGGWAVFAPDPSAPRPGRIVLARHPKIRDPDLEGPITLRIWQRRGTAADGPWAVPDVVLATATEDPSSKEWILAEDEMAELRVLAELVEIL